MFVRFRQTARRLQVSLVETARLDRRVRHSHVASLGSVPREPSPADRIALWIQLHQRLGRLSNRIDAATQGAILTAIHARIPMATPDEQQAEQLAAAQEDARQRGILADIQTGLVDDNKVLLTKVAATIATLEATATAAAADADAAKERLAKVKRGEAVSVDRPMTRAEVLKAAGWTEADARHAARLIRIDRLGGWKTLMDEEMKRQRRGEKAVSRAVLRRLLRAQSAAE